MKCWELDPLWPAPGVRTAQTLVPAGAQGPVPEQADDALLGDDAAEAHDPSEDSAALDAPMAPGTDRLPTPSEDQLAAWLGRIVERDEQALAALYDATQRRVFNLVLRLARRPALAEEVVEDTYFQVWRQAVRFDPARGRALTWLLGMARSRAIDALRREARFQADPLNEDDRLAQPDPAPLADDLLDTARHHAALHRALLRLNPQPRQLVALAFFRGLSHEEIAQETSLPLGTVKSQIRRALLTLQQLLGDAGAAPAWGRS